MENTAPPAGRADRSMTVAAASFIVGIAFLIGGALVGGTAFFIGVGAGIALAVVSVYLSTSGKPNLAGAVESAHAGPIRESLRQAEADMKDVQSKMTQDAAPLGLGQIDDPSLFAAEESIDEDEGRLQERTRLCGALDDAKALTKRRRARFKESNAAVEDAKRQT